MQLRDRIGPGSYDNRIRPDELSAVCHQVLELQDADIGLPITAVLVARCLALHPLRVQQALAMLEEDQTAFRAGRKTDWRVRRT